MKYLFFFLWIISFSAIAKSPSIQGSAEADFIYVDGLVTNKISLNTSRSQSQELESSHRTFGLARMLIGFNLIHKSSFLRFTLRPDAELNREGDNDSIVRDWDTRSGVPYRSAPEIKLLDTYELGFFATDNFSASYGVFDQILDHRLFFSEPLQFGLQVRFPRKFASFKITWSLDRYPTSTSKSNWDVSLFSIEGTDDRHSKITQSSKSQDSGVSANDAYTGIGTLIKYTSADRSRYHLFLGYNDTDIDAGKITDLMIAAGGRSHFNINRLKSLLNFDLRYSRERWTADENLLPVIEQTNYSIEYAYINKNNTSFFVSFLYGTAEVPSDPIVGTVQNFRGQQFTLGVTSQLHPHLTLSFLVSDEIRELEQSGIKSGGFTIGEDDVKRINRILLSINYRSDFEASSISF